MKLSGYADKITGLVAIGGWGAIAATAADGTALALLAEPVSGGVILASHLALQMRQSRNDVCASAIDKMRDKTEREINKMIGKNAEYSEAIRQAFADFDAHIADVRPSLDDLVGLWRLDPVAIADGLMQRLSAKSEVIRSNHVARNAIAQVIAGAVVAFKDEPALFTKLEPALARQYLAEFGFLANEIASVRATGEDTNLMMRQLLAKLETSGKADGAREKGVSGKSDHSARQNAIKNR